jgi:hypothetical protein
MSVGFTEEFPDTPPPTFLPEFMGVEAFEDPFIGQVANRYWHDETMIRLQDAYVATLLQLPQDQKLYQLQQVEKEYNRQEYGECQHRHTLFFHDLSVMDLEVTETGMLQLLLDSIETVLDRYIEDLGENTTIETISSELQLLLTAAVADAFTSQGNPNELRAGTEFTDALEDEEERRSAMTGRTTPELGRLTLLQNSFV